MTPLELAAGLVLVGILIGMASYFAFAQSRLLRSLGENIDLRPDDQRYFRRQAYRRLLGSGTMVLFAGLLLGSFALEGAASEMVAKGQAARERGEKAEFSPEERRFFDMYSWYWIVCLLVLLALLAIAAVDFFAIWRYGIRHYRRLQQDRRAMVAGQAARLRSRQNGRH